MTRPPATAGSSFSGLEKETAAREEGPRRRSRKEKEEG